MGKGGDMPTNVGINYQQRVSASFLTLMLLEQEILILINNSLFQNKNIISLQLEGVERIDDLIITLEDNQKLFLQIKRSVSLSDSKESDFYKTVEQFMLQYLNNKVNESFFLITSSISSNKIIKELKKILDSIRLSGLSFNIENLNKSEQDTWRKYNKIVKQIFKKYTKRNMEDNEFIEFTKKVFILNFDIEENSTMESSVFILMATKVKITPSILWDILISNCLKYASQRMSIDINDAKGIYGNYLKDTDIKLSENNNFNILDDFLIPEFQDMNIASGKEVLLCKPSNVLPDIDQDGNSIDLSIVELFRFDDECNKKVEFTNDYCILGDKKSKLEVLFRASTNAGLERYLDENIDLFTAKSINIFPANDIDYVESSLCAKAYSENLKTKIKKHTNYLQCIECGKLISDNNSNIVEIDQLEYDNNIGLVHHECLRATHRVLGRVESNLFQDYSALKNFDWKLWVKKLMKGQGLFANKIVNQPNMVKTVLWNSSIEYDTGLNYCVKEHLEDGTSLYVLRRGKVECFRKGDAENVVIMMNKRLNDQKEVGNPLCITQKEKAFSTYSVLKNIIDIDDKLLKILNFSVEKVTPQIIQEYSNVDNYYTPLFYILEGEEQELFAIGDCVVLMNDPFQFEDYLNNWKDALEMTLDSSYEIIIIQDDKHFDNFMHSVYKKDLKATINPQFDLEGNMINGYLIEKLEDIQEKLN